MPVAHPHINTTIIDPTAVTSAYEYEKPEEISLPLDGRIATKIGTASADRDHVVKNSTPVKHNKFR